VGLWMTIWALTCLVLRELLDLSPPGIPAEKAFYRLGELLAALWTQPWAIRASGDPGPPASPLLEAPEPTCALAASLRTLHSPLAFLSYCSFFPGGTETLWEVVGLGTSSPF
jgi:hypothetical protein